MQLLPRVDQLWYKYIHMEEMLGNVAAARQIFERWMTWEPDHHGWTAYIKVRAQRSLLPAACVRPVSEPSGPPGRRWSQSVTAGSLISGCACLCIWILQV